MSVPRGQLSESSSSLPSARTVSNTLIADLNRPSADFTLMLMQWGQFLDHDLTHTPLTKGEFIPDKFLALPINVRQTRRE